MFSNFGFKDDISQVSRFEKSKLCFIAKARSISPQIITHRASIDGFQAECDVIVNKEFNKRSFTRSSAQIKSAKRVNTSEKRYIHQTLVYICDWTVGGL